RCTTLTGFTDHWIQEVNVVSAEIGAKSSTRRPPRLVSSLGSGTVVFSVIPSVQPGARTSLGRRILFSAEISKRPSKINPPRRRSGAFTVRVAARPAAVLVVER